MSKTNKIFVNKDYNPLILKAVLKNNWYWPLIWLCIMLTVSFFYLRYTKEIFEASTLIQIENKDQGREVLNFENLSSKSNISSQIEMMKSNLLFGKAIEKLQMNVSIFTKGNILTDEMYHSSIFSVLPYSLSDSSLCGTPIFINYSENVVHIKYNFKNTDFTAKNKIDEIIKTPHFEIKIKSDQINEFEKLNKNNEYYFVFNSNSSLVGRLKEGLIITPINPEAQTIEIKHQSHNALLSKDIVSSLSSAFFDYERISKQLSSDNILHFINMQLDSLTKELNDSKENLTDYQRSSKLPDPDGVSAAMNSNITQFRDQTYKAQEELNTLNMVFGKLTDEPNRIEIYKIIPEMLGKSYESALSRQIEDLHEILERREDLLFKVKPENAEVQNLNFRIQSKIQSIRKSMQVIRERLIINLKVLINKSNQLEEEFYLIPEKKMEFNRLKSLQDLNEKYFSILTEKKVQYAISRAGYAPTSHILSNPVASQEPINSNKLVTYIALGLLGIIIGGGVLIFKYITFNEVTGITDLKRILPNDINFLGGIPLLKNEMEYSRMVVGESSKTRIAEAMRNIRSNISFVNPEAKTIAITSSVSGEGKTFLVMNLGGIIALSGKKTIIIDLDMRKPKIHLGFNIENKLGISNLIVGKATLADVIHHTDISTLDYITAGDIPPNPSELILSESLEHILEDLKTKYDVIVIDNPPIGLVSDGITMLAKADIPIYVFKSNFSKRQFANRIVELKEVQKIKSLSVILNGIETEGSQYGYEFGYGYGYGYGQGYYTEENV
ncbi:MAG: polysaccharide biosynthesis tyrosine autokinase [Crocinitomicaceae bacterium]|nr:polysaccharide biosynthesis tyrosine autokinase [Crocinitomicaceae bacterium]